VLSTPVLTPRDGYRHWAKDYDAQPNPMLSLERRYLEPLIPCAAGLDVVDLGCGTGRWLEILKNSEPRSLFGIDASREMLRQAKRKLRARACLLLADAESSPLAPASADIVFANFVLSYVEDAQAFLDNIRCALRPGGSMFLTDLHPETTVALNWRRGVQTKTGFQEIRIFERSIESVIALCDAFDLKLSVRLEPCFGEPEVKIFQSAGKMNSFEQSADFPAIYILQFQRTNNIPHSISPQREDGKISLVENSSFALGPQERISGPLRFANTKIEAFGKLTHTNAPRVQSSSLIDLRKFLVFPGLVNPHDHLEFALFPRLGMGNYANSLEWAEDIHRSESKIISRHRQVPKNVRLWWGGIRNLLCGVTTVSHHNPYDSDVFDNNFVVRVVREYGWAHSLALDADAVAKKRATPTGRPFLIHLAEGIDADSGQELGALHRAGALNKDTVIIHGLGLTEEDRELLRDSGAGLIWCPSSNLFLFGRTLSANSIESLPHVALGSDSPLTAEGDLLDEVRLAIRSTQLVPETVYKLVTHQAARILRLDQGQGSIRAGGVADLFAVRDMGQLPAQALMELSYQHVELVLIGGQVHLASDEIAQRLSDQAKLGLQPLLIDETLRWVRAPLDWLFRETESHLPEGIFLCGKQVRLGIHN
jgi:cytosine/adenosine deaminase-related metal-dependent hydrolase/ubiquinone/menaquinone biosynthesis C-methylase UbiE